MFTVSGPDLVIAQCTSGVVGSFPSLNARPQGILDDWLTTITAALAKHDANHPEAPAAPYAVNLIVHRTNGRLEDDLETVVRHEVPIVITSLGARAEVNEAVHTYGGIVLHDVVHDGFARKAVEKGADGLIAVAAGAGGHGGSQSPFALLQEIRAWFDGPLVLSGAIAHGRSVLAAQAAGADLAYVGSAFIATHEALADDSYKRMVVESAAADIVHSDLFTGVPGNYLRGSIEASGLDPDRLTKQDRAVMSWADGTSKVKAWSQVWGSGQGIGVVDAVCPAADLVDRLADEYHGARARLIG
jgi:nitronate monooxygenase